MHPFLELSNFTVRSILNQNLSSPKTITENIKIISIAFVVSVKNSLMENAFVLIGFSGDDPNFLRLEWLDPRYF